MEEEGLFKAKVVNEVDAREGFWLTFGIFVGIGVDSI
jgi:hypothetical protein